MRTSTRLQLCAALLCAAALACETPPLAPALDQYSCPDGGACTLATTSGYISGTLVYSGTRRGDAVVLLFSAGDLPPPDGTATSAVSVALLTEEKLFAVGSGSGPFSGQFVFPNVAPGRYQIRAFLDVAGDFNPFSDYTVSPRAGAPVGGSVTVDASGSATLTSFDVASNKVSTVSVVLGAEAPFDPPAFVIDPAAATDFRTDFDRAIPLKLVVFNPGVAHAQFASPKFPVELKRSSSGAAQVSDGDGLVDVFPQVTLKQLDAINGDGSTSAVASADAAYIPCKVQATPLLPLLLASTSTSTPYGLDTVQILIEPLAVKLSSTGVATPLAAIPPGHYQVVVVGKLGQVWTVPNSLGTLDTVNDPTGKLYIPSQGHHLSFTSQAASGGSIAGKVKYPAGRTPGNLIVQAYKGGAAYAPPLSPLLPFRVKSIPARFLSLDTSNAVSYSLEGLPPGNYVVEALDDGDGNFNSLALLQTPTKGDLVGGVLDGTGHFKTIAVSGAVTGQDVTLVGAPGVDGQGNGTPLDPPAFVLDETSGPAQIAQDARGTVRITVRAQPTSFPIGASTSTTSGATTFFTVGLVRDSAGNPVDSDGDGLPDVWPRAALVKLADSDPTLLTQDSPTTVIPVAVDPTPFLPALLSGSKELVLPATRLSLIVRPAALNLTDPTSPARLAAMPAGKYKLVLLNKTGQVWQIPNDAGPAALDARVQQCAGSTCSAGQVNTASQGRYFSVLPPAAPVPTGEIDGALALSGSSTPATVASVVFFAWHAEDPPPPLGTGRTPASADVHTGAEYAAAVASGQRLSFALRGLSAGSYYVTALVDTRGDLALDPQLWTAAPGPGALKGAVVNGSGAPVAVAVSTSAVTGQTVAVSADVQLPARPSFALSSGGAPITSDLASPFTDAVTTQRITLRAGGRTDGAGVWGPVLDANVAALKPESGATSWSVSFRACNAAAPAQGADADSDGLPDLWPRILVVKLSDADASGLTLDPATTLIPAAVDPTKFVYGLGACSSGQVLSSPEVDVLLSPVAVQPQADGTFKQLPIPAGRYGLVAIDRAGQTWRIPNELQPSLLDPRAAATAAGAGLAAQGVGIRVASQVPAPLGGGIGGSVKLQNYSAADVGNLLVAVYSAAAPPPPLGLGRPVATQLIPAPVVASNAGGAQPYFVGNLPPGSYLVAALLDPLSQFSPSLGYLATPPRKATIAFSGGASPAVIAVGSAAAGADVTLDKLATAAIPFERPSFKLDATSVVSVSASATPGTAALVKLVPEAQDSLPYTPLAAAFHPIPAKDATGQPYRDSSPGANCAGNKPWVSSQVYVSPLDTGSRYVPLVKVDQCQFCQSLTGTADCSGALLASPAPFSGPLLVAVTNVAVDPLTRSAAGVPLPQGHYALTLVEPTGQLWTVPNELARSGGNLGGDQSAWFTVLP
jgi:uncharacterized protein (DUF2141 family)